MTQLFPYVGIISRLVRLDLGGPPRAGSWIVPDPLFHGHVLHVSLLAEEETFQMWAKELEFPEMVRYPQASRPSAKRHVAG
jgi:hypothetical protein